MEKTKDELRQPSNEFKTPVIQLQGRVNNCLIITENPTYMLMAFSVLLIILLLIKETSLGDYHFETKFLFI